MQRQRRRGTTAIESVLVFSIVFMLLFVIFDLGLATFQANLLTACAKSVARQAIVRGGAASPQQPTWGPTNYSATADDSSTIAQGARILLATMAPAEVEIEMQWLDGDNREGDRVKVELTYEHRPLVPFLGLTNSLVLRGRSIMRIAH